MKIYLSDKAMREIRKDYDKKWDDVEVERFENEFIDIYIPEKNFILSLMFPSDFLSIVKEKKYRDFVVCLKQYENRCLVFQGNLYEFLESHFSPQSLSGLYGSMIREGISITSVPSVLVPHILFYVVKKLVEGKDEK